jgi:hypothetical protein
MTFKAPEHCVFNHKRAALGVLNGFMDLDCRPLNPSQVLEHGMIHQEIWLFSTESRTYQLGIQEGGAVNV